MNGNIKFTVEMYYVNYSIFHFKKLLTTRKFSYVNARGIPPLCIKYTQCCSSWGYPRPDQGPDLDRGYPLHPDLGWGTPIRKDEVPPLVGKDGVPPSWEGRDSLSERMGVLPSPVSRWGYPPPPSDVN